MSETSIALFRSFQLPVLAIWPYLTRPERLEHWLGAADLEVEVGGTLEAKTWNGDAVSGRVLRVVPPNRLDLAWCAEGFETESRVGLRIEHDGPGSRVTVSHERLLTDVERGHATAWWKQALAALRAAVQEERPAHEWGDGLPIVLRAPLGRTREDIWPLLATPQGIEKWLARAERFDAEAGGGFRFTSRYKGVDVIEEGRIEAFEPEHRLALTWEWVGRGWGAPTLVELFLEPDAGGVALLLSHSGFDRLAAETRLEARRDYVRAWADVMGDLRRLVAPG